MRRLAAILVVLLWLAGCLSVPHRADNQATDGAAGTDQSTETKISGVDASKSNETKVVSQGDAAVENRNSGLDASQNPKAETTGPGNAKVETRTSGVDTSANPKAKTTGPGDAKSENRTSGIDLSRNDDLTVRSRGPAVIQTNDPWTLRILAIGAIASPFLSYPVGKALWLGVGGLAGRRRGGKARRHHHPPERR